MAGLLSGGLRKVAGNLAGSSGLGGISSKSPAFGVSGFFDLLSSGRNQTENLAYPLNVEDDPGQGHHIIFEIMKQDKAKLAGTKFVKSVKGQLDAASSETGQKKSENATAGSGGGSPGLGGRLGAAARTGANAFKAAAISKGQRGASNSMQVSRNATTAMPVCIALYMPPSVKVDYGANYNETSIGIGAEAINSGIKAFMDAGGGLQGGASALGTGAGAAVSGALTYAKDKALTILPGMEGVDAVFAINRGSVITPRMELMFEGLKRREFSFSFTFIPKSEQEAEVVKKICHKFKFHMASDYGMGGLGGVDGVREMDIPDFFNIRYMYGKGTGRESNNPHLNLIKQCVLTTCSIEYGADRYKAYADGRPQTTKLSLGFQELEIITKTYIGQGY